MGAEAARYDRKAGVRPRRASEYKKYRARVSLAKKAAGWIAGGSLAVFVVIIAAAIINEGTAAFVKQLSMVNPFYFFIALLLMFLSNAMRYPKWSLYMKRLGIRISSAKNFVIYLSMYSMEITPGRWGRAIVSYTINSLTRTTFANIFPAIVADIFTDFSGFAVVSVGAALLLDQYVALSLGITALLLLPFLFLYVKTPFDFIRKRLGHMRRLKPMFRDALVYFKSNKKIRAADYLYSMAFTIPSMLLNGVVLYFVILSFGVRLPVGAMPEVIFIFSSSLLLGAISGIPAALGVTDAALIGYLVLFFGNVGIDFGLASIIAIFFRIVNWWFVEGFGFAALAYTFRYWKVPSQQGR
ncbi:MAG: flippase-like domain-containing protein [Candidatus Marsarchaeota archaeon]|nr:flippase-like domain-containing protein [Candidatus Marsarchaeota archaeon]